MFIFIAKLFCRVIVVMKANKGAGMKMTTHAANQVTSRRIPLQIIELVHYFGAETYDHHGGVIRFLDKKAMKRLGAEGALADLQLARQYRDVYLVESSNEHTLISAGYRYKRIRNA